MSSHARHPRTRARTLITGALLIYGGVCFGFAEDVCPGDDGGWTVCDRRPCSAGSEMLGCETVTLATTFLSQITRGEGARSTLHFDSTYYLAQAAGYTPREAYLMAAYNESADMGQFVLLDQRGKTLLSAGQCASSGSSTSTLGCDLVPMAIGGVNRNNFATGGVFFHFMTPGGRGYSTDGLAPPVDDPVAEPFLDHVRRWAFGGGPLCIDGLTTETANGNYAEGSSCYAASTGEAATLVGKIPFLTQTGFVTSLDWVSTLGVQPVLTDPATAGTSTPSYLPAPALEDYLSPDDARMARLGIYLHALADRISHHVCVDYSNTTGPLLGDAKATVINTVPYNIYMALLSGDLATASQIEASGLNIFELKHPTFRVKFSATECDQFDHAQRHTFETGTPQRNLTLSNQTASAGLNAVLKELIAYRLNYPRGTSSVSLRKASSRQQVLASLIHALESHSPQQRLDALTKLARSSGWLPLPGYGGVSLAEWERLADAPRCGIAVCVK